MQSTDEHINKAAEKSNIVLVVDDNVMTLRLIEKYLNHFGYKTYKAENGERALQIVSQIKGIDLIILDVMMPGMDGHEVCANVRKKFSLYELPVLFLTSLKETEDVVKGLEAGANDYLVKPFNNRELLARTQTLIKLKKLTLSNISLRANVEVKNKYLKQLSEEIAIRKKVEKDLIRAKEKADAANRLKSEFVANMSHEIRTPMNAIIGFSELLSSRIKDPKNIEYISSVVNSSKNLLDLINDILDLSKIEADKISLAPKPLDIKRLLSDIRGVFILRIEDKDLEMRIEIDDDLPAYLIVDESRLRQILINLMGNAVKFTRKGFIRLAATNIVNDGNIASIAIIVEDSGIGIPEKDIVHVFEAFYQPVSNNSESYGGTGLGLTITKRLVELMGGSISLESSDRGTKFTVFLPEIEIAAEEEIVYSETKSELDTNIIFPGSKILIADDVENNRKYIKEILKDKVSDIYETDNGRDAVEILKHFKPDIILMDMKMPVMDGFEATIILKSNPGTASIPIIGLTAFAMEEEKDKLFDTGIDSYVKKPVSAVNLLLEMRKFLYFETIESETEVLIESETESRYSEFPDQIKILLDLLDKFISPKVDELKKSGRMKLIKELAFEIVDAGNSYQTGLISDFGNDLLKAANNFDQQKVKKLLKNYDNLIDELKNYLDNAKL